MPFPGAEMALGCVGGRQVAILLPVLGHGGQTRRDFLGEKIPGDIWVGFYRPATGGLRIRASEPARHRRMITGRFFIETVAKRYMFGTGSARKWLDLA